MATIEERVAFLEGRVGEHGQMISGIRDALVSLEARMDRRFEGIDRRFEAIDRRFDTIDRRFEAIDRRFESLEGRLGGLDARVGHQFIWLVGIQITTLVTVLGVLLAR